MFKIVSKTNPKDVKTVYHIIVSKGASRHFKFVIFDEEDEEWTTVSSANYRPLPQPKLPFRSGMVTLTYRYYSDKTSQLIKMNDVETSLKEIDLRDYFSKDDIIRLIFVNEKNETIGNFEALVTKMTHSSYSFRIKE